MITSSAVLEINTKNILHNYKYLASISKSSLTGATVKANAYGLGVIKIFNRFRNFFIQCIIK